MEEKPDLIYLGAGPLLALLLGIGCFPLRAFTHAANFTFLFMALTIVIAELGGRRAAVATALTSALSLDFFLTEPLLQLRIDDKEDVIAFVGLALCGLLVAVFASARGRHGAAVERVRAHMEAIHAAACRLEDSQPTEHTCDELLRALRERFPIGTVVLRDVSGHVVASCGPPPATAPAHVLQPDSLLPTLDVSAPLEESPRALSRDGGRLALSFKSARAGTLELWGNGKVAGPDDRRDLTDAARIIGALLADREATRSTVH